MFDLIPAARYDPVRIAACLLGLPTESPRTSPGLCWWCRCWCFLNGSAVAGQASYSQTRCRSLSTRGENQRNPLYILHSSGLSLGHLRTYVRVHDALVSSPLAIALLLAMPAVSGRTPGLLVRLYIYKRAGLTVFAG